MGTQTALIALLSVSLLTAPIADRINLHGCKVGTKRMSTWELYRYRDTELMRRYPLCYAPYKSYLLKEQYVTITNQNNRNYLIIKTDLYKAAIPDAKYNRRKAKIFKGTDRQKVRKIWRYCKQTTYIPHVKTASDVFRDRQGDCAAIASAFYVLCKKNKIPVRYVIGWTRDGCHAWNRVKVGGKWYWIDATLGHWLWRDQFEGRTVMEMW